MNFIANILKGIIIGAGCILPGISSGVLCVVFGIYEKLVNSILNIFKDFKKNFLFLLPYVIGAFIGIFLFGNILEYLFNNYNNIIKYMFIGLILGTTPALLKQSNNKKYIKITDFLYTFITFMLALFLLYLEKNIIPTSNITTNFFYLFISGFLMSVGVVIPGVSSTVILLCLGIYSTYLNAISTLNLIILLPFGIGLVCGAIIFLNIINFLFKKFPSQTMYSIIGFVIGSIFILLPNTFNVGGLIVFFISLIISFYLEKINK